MHGSPIKLIYILARDYFEHFVEDSYEFSISLENFVFEIFKF